MTGTPIKEGKPICYTAKSGRNMTEEPNKNEAALPEKLLIDDPMNFPFHAAYVVYAELFDNIHDADAREDLNRNISHHRNMGHDQRRERFSLQTQRKRDWRKKAQRQDRIKRHKK